VARVSTRLLSLPAARGGAPAGPLPLPCVELDELEPRGAGQTRAWRQLEPEALLALLRPWGLPGEGGLPLDLELELLPASSRLLLLAASPALPLLDHLLESAPAAAAAAVAALCRLHAFREAVLLRGPAGREGAGRLAALLEKILPVRVVALEQGHPWDHPRLAARAAGCPLPDPARPLAAQGLLALGLDRLWDLEARLAGEWPLAPFWLLVQRLEPRRGLPAASWQRLCQVWPGTPLGELLSALGLDPAEELALAGSPLEASPLLDPESPLLPGLRQLSLLPVGDLPAGGAEACISCGQCLDICPVRLAPLRLARLVEERRLPEARELGLPHCLDCGLCTWICPSRVELGHHLRRGRLELEEARLG
jgi:electron transport complex protein RnfC